MSLPVVGRALVPCAKLSRNAVTEGIVAQRWYAAQGQVHPGYQKNKEKYKRFQVDDGVPIHVKGGAFDRFLYYTTLAGCAVGTVMCLEYYYSAAFPKKC